MSRRLDDVRLAALMLDGIDLKGSGNVVALGIITQGVTVPLGLWDGSTENKTVARHLLADLVDRGLDVEQGVLVVLDGGKALLAAVGEVLGPCPFSGASTTRREMCWTTSPSATVPRSSAGCGRRGSSPTAPPRSTGSASSPASLSAATPGRRLAARGPR